MRTQPSDVWQAWASNNTKINAKNTRVPWTRSKVVFKLLSCMFKVGIERTAGLALLMSDTLNAKLLIWDFKIGRFSCPLTLHSPNNVYFALCDLGQSRCDVEDIFRMVKVIAIGFSLLNFFLNSSSNPTDKLQRKR